MRVDVMMPVTGLSFTKAWAHRRETVLDGVTVYIISREDLITVKRATGRPRDLLEVNALEASGQKGPSSRYRDDA